MSVASQAHVGQIPQKSARLDTGEVVKCIGIGASASKFAIFFDEAVIIRCTFQVLGHS